MTFSADIPRNLESPAVFPAQCRTNWSRLKTIINADHVFNDTSQADDGIHRQVTIVNRAPTNIPPVLPSGSNGMIYSYLDDLNRNQLAWFNGVNVNPLTPFQLRVAVNFDGTGGVGNKLIRSSYNVQKVERLATTGNYKITFNNALPDNNYIVHVTGRRQTTGTNGISNGAVLGGGTYAGMVSTTDITIVFNGSGSDVIDVDMGNLIIFSVT